MQNESASSTIIRFGTFELDVRAGELRKRGVKIALQEQPLRILELLLAHPGQLVTREELRDRLWPSDTFVDFDHSLNKAINKLREALGDSAEAPRFIETVPKRGYRFVKDRSGDSGQIAIPEASIAVLPFVNLTSDPENELFADGICEEIIFSLTQIKDLHVAARTSSFSFKGKFVDLRTVGQQLNVRTLLEGSVRRSGDRLRVSAQLVNVADGYHLWSRQYDRELKDLFAIQEEIAHSIAQSLEVTLDSESQPLVRGGTENVEAFKSFIRGRGLFFQRGPRLLASVECFKRAIALDPKYALAWSGLADAYNMIGLYGVASPETCLPQAREAAQRATELGPSLAEAHTSLAASHLLCDWDRARSESEFLRSLELKPDNALARGWYGYLYLQCAARRFEEGAVQLEQAVRIDPLSAWARALLAIAYVPVDADRCLEAALEALRIDPDHFLGRFVQMTALKLLGRPEESARVGESTLGMSGRAAWVMSGLARTYARMGRRADAEALYMELRWRARREYVAPAILGWAAWAVGEHDEAIRLEEEAHAIGDPILINANYWPDYADLREDPRFQEILRARGWT
jgi:TolB-like protein/Tfp pilus assembly protein PilF